MIAIALVMVLLAVALLFLRRYRRTVAQLAPMNLLGQQRNLGIAPEHQVKIFSACTRLSLLTRDLRARQSPPGGG